MLKRLLDRWRLARLEADLASRGYCFTHQIFRRYWSNYAGDGFDSCKQCEADAELAANKRLDDMVAEYQKLTSGEASR